MENRIQVKGNGNQAPYGIDETIETFANTNAGLKKAVKFATKWYQPATIVRDGELVNPYDYADHRYDGLTKSDLESDI